MADNIDGLYGMNLSAGTNKLLAAYGNDVVDVVAGTGYHQNLTAGSSAEMVTYVDNLYLVNGTDATRSFDGTNWTSTNYRVRCPIAKYIYNYRTRLYLAYTTINGTDYASRVVYSGLPHNDDARWEIEWGSALEQTADSAVVTDRKANFITANIKAGDPIFILAGNNAGEYTVSSVDSEIQLTLVEDLVNTVASSTYWVGSNWFDVKTDNNDYIRGLGENSDRLLIFKLNSIHRYNDTSLFQIGDYPGTSSHRSIQNVNSYTYYFHGSESTRTGIYVYDGSSVVKVSAAIQPYVDGIAASIFPTIVGWREGDWYRCYVGDIDNAQRNISEDKVILSHNSVTNKWSIDPINKTVKAKATWLESNEQKIFFGDDSAEVFQTPSGYSLDGESLAWALETGVHYPEDSESINRFNRIQIISRDARAVKVQYKLYNQPKTVDDQWSELGEISEDKTELKIPRDHNWASGINIRLSETSIREATQYIEKITLFYEFDTNEML